MSFRRNLVLYEAELFQVEMPSLVLPRYSRKKVEILNFWIFSTTLLSYLEQLLLFKEDRFVPG